VPPTESHFVVDAATGAPTLVFGLVVDEPLRGRDVPVEPLPLPPPLPPLSPLAAPDVSIESTGASATVSAVVVSAMVDVVVEVLVVVEELVVIDSSGSSAGLTVTEVPPGPVNAPAVPNPITAAAAPDQMTARRRFTWRTRRCTPT
jgi:hypothetical protein